MPLRDLGFTKKDCRKQEALKSAAMKTSHSDAPCAIERRKSPSHPYHRNGAGEMLTKPVHCHCAVQPLASRVQACSEFRVPALRRASNGLIRTPSKPLSLMPNLSRVFRSTSNLTYPNNLLRCFLMIFAPLQDEFILQEISAQLGLWSCQSAFGTSIPLHAWRTMHGQRRS